MPTPIPMAQPGLHHPAARPLRGLTLAVLSGLAGLALCSASAHSAGSPAAVPSLAEVCAGFRPAALPHGATFDKTEVRPADGSLPTVCIVRGSIVSSPESTIHWAVELPERKLWNGKTLTIGGGGFDGFIPTDDPWYQTLVGPSANAFVKISSDSGHPATGFSWGNSDAALRNHAFEANHFALAVGTRIAKAFYGKAPRQRYHFGHSNGGRSGLIAAQKYPNDYDGIVAMEPAINQQAHQSNLGPTVLRHIFSDRANWLGKEKIALYAKAEMAACDGLDGLKDGILGNIEACTYVPTELLCTGADAPDCLTAGQIESIRLIYATHDTGVPGSRGQTGYPRYGRGGASTSDWQVYMFGTTFEARDSFNYMAVSQAAKLVENQPELDLMKHDPTQFKAAYRRLAEQIDGTDPDLSAFARGGGKLLIWYGSADTCVSLYRTVDYVESVRQRLGARALRSFARLATSPSVGHELDGAGTSPHSIDLLAAMDQWVNKGRAPDRLVASKFEPGSRTPVLQRPVCEYPAFPRYKGKGDPKRAESFRCATR